MGEFDFDVVSDMDELLRLRQPPAEPVWPKPEGKRDKPDEVASRQRS